jgi:prophage regulatory protein
MTEKFLRLPAVIEATGLSCPTIYRLIRKGSFPKQIQLSENSVGWRQSEISAWMAARIASAREAA